MHVRVRTGLMALGACCLSLCGSSSPSAAASKAVHAWPTKTIASFPNGISNVTLAPDAPLVIGEVSDSGLDAFTRLYGLDLATGRVIRGSLVFSGAALVTAGDGLAVVEPRVEVVEPNGGAAPSTGSTAEELRLLRPGGAEVQSASYLPLDLPEAVAPLSPGSSAIWAGARGEVVLISLSTGKVLRSVTLPEAGAQFTVSVLGSTLYAIGDAVGTKPIEIYEVALGAGRIVASTSVSGVGGDVTAVPGGVWLSYRTGMLGTAELLAASSLKVESSPPRSSTPDLPAPGSIQGMGIEVVVTGATAWMTDFGGIACVDATTGDLRSSAPFAKGTGFVAVVGAIGRTVYAAIDSATSAVTRIAEIDAPAACWG